MAEHIILENRSQLTVVTPMMKQYLDVKAEYEDHILMYRLGDFYECFFEDAVIASRELELTLTSRDCGDGKRAAMCGVPFHKSDVYVGRLVEKGIKVAICEQVSDPKESAGLVKRDPQGKLGNRVSYVLTMCGWLLPPNQANQNLHILNVILHMCVP